MIFKGTVLVDVSKIDGYEFMTPNEIAKAIGKRVKAIRKKQFRSQKIFAQHIGMAEETYARFERTGLISFTGLISVARGLEHLEEIVELFSLEKEIIQWK